jgi:methionyl-tRNA formyltransferase
VNDPNPKNAHRDRPRAIFFGTPDFAVPCLSALLEVAEVVLVVTQPDRPRGRGMKLEPPPIKILAEESGVEVIQPKKVRTQAFAQRLRDANADLGVVVAYGRILPTGVLEAPRLGCVNVHASLLPKYRGAAPVHWAIVNGETETGVCLMQMDEGMDTGPVLAVSKTAIGPDETAGELSERLCKMGASLLREQLPLFVRRALTASPQDHDWATLAPLLKKENGQVNWNRTAREIHNLVRGMSPWPGAFSWLQQQRVKLHRAHVLVEGAARDAPGTIIRADSHTIDVACAEGVLAIDELQVEGKRRMAVSEFLAGCRPPGGCRFEATGP